MKINKGFVGLGALLTIVLGLAATGSGAYYIVKNKISFESLKHLTTKQTDNIISDASTSCITSLYSEDRTKYNFWKDLYGKRHPEYEVYDSGSYCKLDNGTQLVSFSFFKKNTKKEGGITVDNAGQSIALFDLKNNFLQETKNLFEQTIGDLSYPKIEEFNHNTVKFYFESGDAGVVTKKTYELNLDTFTYTKIGQITKESTSQSENLPVKKSKNSSFSNNSPSTYIDDTLVLTQEATLQGAVPPSATSLSILVGKGEVTPPQKGIGPDSMSRYALGESSDAGGIMIKDGRWYAGIKAPSGDYILEPGMYTVALYNGEDSRLLASEKVTVKAFMTIDKASLVSSSSIPTITGKAASSVKKVSITIQFYNYAKLDWVNLSFGDVPVINGKWSYTKANSYASLGTYAPGSYRVIASPYDNQGNVIPNTTISTSLTIK